MSKLWLEAAKQQRENAAIKEKEAEERRLEELKEKAALLGSIDERRKRIAEKFGARTPAVVYDEVRQPAPQAPPEPQVSEVKQPKKPITKTEEVSMPVSVEMSRREKKKKAIAQVRGGTSVVKTAKKFNVPISTVYGWTEKVREIKPRAPRKPQAMTPRQIGVVDPDKSIDALIMQFEEVRHQHLDEARKLENKIKALRAAR